jgi:hypothetical protein
MRRMLSAACVAVAAAFAVAKAPAHAAVDQPIAVWRMNEAPGSRTMVDSSGHGLNGTTSSHVQVGTALSGGGTGYRFPRPPAEHAARRPRACGAGGPLCRDRVRRAGFNHMDNITVGTRVFTGPMDNGS